MAYFLRHFKNPENLADFGDHISKATIQLLSQHSCAKQQDNMTILQPVSSFGKDSINTDTNTQNTLCPDESVDICKLMTVATPSNFGASAIARQLVLQFSNSLQLSQTDSFNLQTLFNSDQSSISANPSSGRSLKMVTLGLNCLQSVLIELNERDPQLCSNALSSLQLLLQALNPEDLASEPRKNIAKLFCLLKELRLSANEEVSSKASCCMISLAVAYGFPDLLIQSSFSFISQNSVNCTEQSASVQIPDNYRSLVHALLLEETESSHIYANGRRRAPSWFAEALTNQNFLFSLLLPEECITDSPDDRPTNCGAVASDGAYLYVLTARGLYKLGTGFMETVLGHQYASNLLLKANADSWLTVCSGSLYLRRRHSTKLWVLDSDSLREIGEILLPTAAAQGALCTDGQSFQLMTHNENGHIMLHSMNENFIPADETALDARLTQIRYSYFGDEVPENLLPALRTVIGRQVADLKVCKDVAVMLAKTGKVFYLGNGARFSMQDSIDTWLELSFTEPIASISMSHDGSNLTFRSVTGQLWYVGNGNQIDLAPLLQATVRNKSTITKPKRLTAPNHRRIISCAISASITAFVTENGRVFSYGRHSTHSHPETGQILGLDQVHVISIALGKTHAVALSKHGSVYTWGMNNLYQCGKAEPLPLLSSQRTTDSSEPSSEGSARFQLCAPSEHLWVKDVATFCAACGMCTAHGPSCPKKQASPSKGAVSSCGQGETGCLRCGVCRRCGDRESSPSTARSDKDSDYGSEKMRKMNLSPTRLVLRGPEDIKIARVSCGNYHTVLLSTEGQVYTFGSNCHGQLGLEDTRRKIGPQQVSLAKDTRISRIAAGSNHTVLMTRDGLVYTFGSNRQGQLGREGKGKNWHAKPGLVPGINVRAGLKALWVGATGDVTLVQFEQQIVHASTLESGFIVANQQFIMVFPKSSTQTKNHYLVIERKSGRFQEFSSEILRRSALAWTLDPSHDILWGYDVQAQRVHAYSFWKFANLMPNQSVQASQEPAELSLQYLKSPEFSIPSAGAETLVSCAQLGLHTLSMLYGMTLSYCKTIKGDNISQDTPVSPNNEENYRVINRFQSYGGGWGYSAQSVEAIQFQPSQDIELIGIGLYGGRGEYLVRLKIMRLVGQDYDENNLELVSESEEMLFDCAPRDKAHLFFSKPLICSSNHWYIAWAQINGPSSDCGAGGLATATGDDGVTFQFRNSRLSNNGTDVHVGQIPLLLYRAVQISGVEVSAALPEGNITSCYPDLFMNKLKWMFCVTPAALEGLLALVQWTMKKLSGEISTSGESQAEKNLEWEMERTVVIGLLALRLLRIYLKHQTSSTTVISTLRKLLDGLLECNPNVMADNPIVFLLEEAVLIYTDNFNMLFSDNESARELFAKVMHKSDRSAWCLFALLTALSKQECPLTVLLSSTLDAPLSLCQSLPAFASVVKFLVELSFAPSTPEVEGLGQSHVRDAANKLLIQVAKELVQTSDDHPAVPVLRTPSRFRRMSSQPVWDSSTGTPEAIAFRVDSEGINLHGVGVYVGSGGSYSYNLEVLLNQGDGFQDSWHVIEKTTGSIPATEFGSKEMSLVRLRKPVKLTPNSLYAARLYWQGGKTWCGESGLNSVRTTNSSKFIFQPCSLSLNGTSVARGQIPSVLYSLSDSSNAAKLTALDREQRVKWFVQLLRMIATKLLETLTSGLVPCDTELFLQLFGWTAVFVERHPNHALEVLSAVDECLPVIAAANSSRRPLYNRSSKQTVQVVLESDHPYQSGQITSSVIRFDSDVRYSAIEFDEHCITAQSEDSLTLYWSAGNDQFYPIGRFGGRNNWPRGVIMIPGSTLWFFLETASAYEKPPPEDLYGYRCLITGFSTPESDPLMTLEHELSWICSMACRILTEVTERSALILKVDNADEAGRDMIQQHGGLLRKGMNLSHALSIQEVISGTFPRSAVTTELKFLNEFITGSSQTIAGKLARWFSPDPFIDLQNCDIILSDETLQSGRDTQITLIPKDQYGRVATADGMNVEITVKSGNLESSPDYGAKNIPSVSSVQKDTYQPTYLNKARYSAITMMASMQNYSFEEIRLGYFKDTVMRESITMYQSQDGCFRGSWVPKQGGAFVIECRLDGFRLPQSYRVEVEDVLNSSPTKATDQRKVAQLSRAKQAICPHADATNGIRVRSAPSLSAQPIGVIPRGGTVTFIEEIDNMDGVWIRLSDDSALLYCKPANFPSQAWALQFNRHTDRVQLKRTVDEEEQPIEHDDLTESIVVTCEEVYDVTNTDHLAVYNVPSISEKPIGQLPLGATISAIGWLHNKEGVWIRLSSTSLQQASIATESDAFCMAQDAKNSKFLERRPSNEVQSVQSTKEKTTAPVRPTELGSRREKNSSDSVPFKKPTAHVWPRQSARAAKPADAIAPSLLDCSRTVFGAVLYHQSLVQDAMACGAFLRFHPELQGIQFRHQQTADLANFNVPRALQLLARLWQEVNSTIQTSITQHLILPSPPMAIPTFPAEQNRPAASRNQRRNTGDQLCELCEEWFPAPIAAHMRLAHPGCGSHSGGQGYNSLGRYSSGWTGNCGDGGRGVATWYLLCSQCRRLYLQSAPSGYLAERSRRGRMFRMSVGAVPPHVIIKQNALFLLELNSSADMVSKDSSSTGASGWRINMFPESEAHSPSIMSQAGTVASRVNCGISDPGPKRHLSALNQSIACSLPASYRQKERAESNGSRMLLASPSVALKTIVSNFEEPTINSALKRPEIAFVIQHHDLKNLRHQMKVALARSTTFAYAFRIWNWLLRTVSTETCVTDVLWNFLAAMALHGKSSVSARSRMGRFSVDGRNNSNPTTLMMHPWRLCLLAGVGSREMVHQFHALLYTVTVILRSDAVDPALRRLCFRCWMFQLTPHEQDVILTCHLLSSVGKVMSDAENGSSWQQDAHSITAQPTVTDLDDLSSVAHIEVSSRSAMVACLTDGTTETFWESGDEEKNKSKTITIKTQPEVCDPIMLGVHVDNGRDDSHRVSQVTVCGHTGNNAYVRKKIHTQVVDSHFVGWIKCCVMGFSRLQVELKGTDPSVRVRLISLIGKFKDHDRHLVPPLKPSPSHLLQFSAAQADAFAVFQAIAAQAFSSEFAEDQSGTLRQQVLDILFSRAQMQPLQGYICSQIVLALEREVDMLRDQGKRNYSYCCGLLNMLTRVARSHSGKEIFGARNNLLPVLSELLLFSSSIVQCQALDTIEKLMGIFSAESTDAKTLVLNLLGVVSKVITMQVRDRSSRSVTSATLQSCVEEAPAGWRLDRPCSAEIGGLVCKLLVDAAYGKFGDGWVAAIQTHVSTHVMNLACLPETERSIEHCLKLKRFWLALAALTVLKDTAWLTECSTGNTRSSNHTVVMCENHDDGRTEAHLYCQVCRGSYCRACYAVLHLSRRNRNHTIEMIAMNANKPEINIHEGCSRLRLPWLLILLDTTTMNGMAEFCQNPPDFLFSQISASDIVKVCRFCQNPTGSEFSDVCQHPECQSLAGTACATFLPCGHICGGVVREEKHLPCLKCGLDPSLRQDSDDLCVICFTDRVGAAPSLQLSCAHVFHYHCCKAALSRRWSGPRIIFSCMKCPLCQRIMEHPCLDDLLQPLRQLYEEVVQKALLRLEYDNLLSCPALTTPSSPFFNNPKEYALERYFYVLCYKCSKAYFGGEAQCQAGLSSSQYNPEELLCGACSDVARAQICPRHGSDFLEYKCRFCCSVAVFFCFGTTHFCTACHDDFQRLVTLPKQRLPQCPVGPRCVQMDTGPCPLKVQHPATGEEFALGCGICRNLSSF